MLDPLLTPLAFFHAFALIGLLVFACRHWQLPRKELPLCVPLLLWATLVLTGHLSSIGSNLGSLAVYVPVSFLSMGLLYGLLEWIRALPSTPPLVTAPAISLTRIDSLKTRRFLFWFLLITLSLFAAISIALGLCVYPNNADSLIYRLPRAIWYVSTGSFLHPFESLDKRLVFYPLDGTALYVPFVLYGLPGTFHSLPSLLSWGAIVYASYRFARELGADRLIGLFCAWLIGLTPGVLAQATSTNDEIIAAAAFLCCLFMGWRWLVTGRPIYFIFSSLALGLSAGTKLHIVFLLPIFFLVGLVALLYLVKNPKSLKTWHQAICWKTTLISLLLIAVMFLPFLFYNKASTDHFYFFDDFKKQVFNLRGNIQGWGQNLLIYLSQMIFSPLADLNVWPVANDRQHFNIRLNQILNPLLKPFIDDDPSFYHLSYRFSGVTLPVSVRFVEFSLWSGFVWLLWPWQSALALKQKNFPLRFLFFLIALTPPLWLLYWSFSTLYMEGTATYFSFYLICAAPAGLFLFARIQNSFWSELRWVCIVLVVLSNMVIAHNLVMYSGFRAIPDLFYAKSLPYDWLLTEEPIIREIRAAKRIRLIFSHEKMPYFGFMHWNPRAKYESPFVGKKSERPRDLENVLQILPVSSMYRFGFTPLKIPNKRTIGATYLGAVRGIGREVLFATGTGVEKRYPHESDYIVLGASFALDEKGQWHLFFGHAPFGLSSEDRLTFEYELKRGAEVVFHRAAKADPSFALRTEKNPLEDRLVLTIVVRDEETGREITRATYPIGHDGAWLPDASEY